MPTASLMPSSFKSIFLALCVTFLAAGIARAQETETEIDYTGSLFGYYRIEPVSGPPRLAPVSEFIKARNQQQGHLLLGMGDNFGPEFGASLQLENKRVHDQDFDCHQIPTVRQDKETIPESLYKDDDRIARHAQCDNVLNFMMQAGFRAVVPGRQDFMYTARWLRGAARLIADASSQPNGSPLISNADKQLYILGANLRLSIKNDMALIQAGGDGGTYKVSKRCPLLFSKSPFGADTPQCGLDGKQSAAFDWLDRLDRLGRLEGNSNDADYRTVTAIQQLAAASVGTAPGKPSALATLVRDEVEIMLAAWGKRADLSALSGLPALIESGKNKVTLDTLSEALDNGKSALKKMEGCPATYPSGLLSTQAPTDYEDLCRYKDDLEKVLDNFKTSMGREPDRNANFMVSDDARKAAIRGLLRTIAIEQKDVGYTIVNPDTNRKILVIGVVGQETMKAVSATNLHLCGAVQADSTWPADFADCHEARKGEAPRNRITASVEVVDPVLATEALIRAARLQFGKFERIVVMAQMPHTDAEVLSTRVWAKLRAVHESAQVDIVLSEAQAGYDSSNITLSYAPGRIPAAKRAMVLTPVTSYSPRDGVFPGAVSRATIKSDAAQTYSIANQPGIYVPTALTGNITTVSLLLDLMTQLQGSSSTPLCANSNVEDCRVRTVMMLMESLQKAAKPRADVVLLQSRDYLLDKIEEDYTDYTMCGEGDHKDIHFNLCKLRVALDRILWKGDYIEFVAVTGKDLKSILDLSKSKSEEQTSLLARDITGEWLISYGIVQSPLSNLTQINQNNEPLWIPVDPACKGEPGVQGEASSTQSVYCIGGTPIADDSYYWVLTTDQLAEDKAVYGTFEALPPVNHKASKSFVTFELAHYLHDHLNDPDIRSTLAGNTPKLENPSEYPVISANGTFQQQPLWQVDFAKTIASFTAREPVGGNNFVANTFQGASDARASAPSQQELDLELASRVTGNLSKTAGARNLPPGSVGIQSGFAYDRALLGNLSPKSKIVNPSYTLNNLTVGGFFQLRLNGNGGPYGVRPVRSLPRNLLVFTPHQYQIQANNTYLFFSYTAPSGITPPAEQLTVTLPRNSSWTDRVGYRREFGQNRANSFFQNGSYVEGGMEFSVQNNVLSSITLQNGSTPKTCQVSSTVTLQSCFYSSSAPGQFLISSSTTIVGAPAMKVLHTPGVYWNLHVQNLLYRGEKRKVSLVTESQGDYFFGRPGSAELSTQTEYAIPLTVALVFPSFANLSFAPTYSGFYYKSQLSNQSLQVNSISIAARWYFARDARVPILMQTQLPGPVSADQNRTGKAH